MQERAIWEAMRRLEQAGAGWANASAEAVRASKEGDWPEENTAYTRLILSIRDLALACLEDDGGRDVVLREQIASWPEQYIGKEALAGAANQRDGA